MEITHIDTNTNDQRVVGLSLVSQKCLDTSPQTITIEDFKVISCTFIVMQTPNAFTGANPTSSSNGKGAVSVDGNVFTILNSTGLTIAVNDVFHIFSFGY